MLNLTGPVRDRTARRHDAAIVQAALILVAFGFTGKVDGDFGPTSQKGLREFMAKKGLKGTIEVRASGPAARALEAALPLRYRDLAAIEATNIVFVPSSGNIAPNRANFELGRPRGTDRFANAIEMLVRRAWERMRLRLRIEVSGIDERSARQAKIHSVGAEWLFVGALRPARPRQIPPVALERLRDLVRPLGPVEVRRGASDPHLIVTWNGERLLPAGTVRDNPALLDRWALRGLGGSEDRRLLAVAAMLLERAARDPAKTLDPSTRDKLGQLEALLRDPRAQKTLGILRRALSTPRVSAAPMEDAARFALRETKAAARAMDGLKSYVARASVLGEALFVVEEFDDTIDIGMAALTPFSDRYLLEFLIRTGNRFDLKPKMRNLFANRTENYDPSSGSVFPFDIWSNIQWGYVGSKVENTLEYLLDRGELAQRIQRREGDPVHDQAAIELGRELWAAHGTGLSLQTFLAALRTRKGRLGRRP